MAFSVGSLIGPIVAGQILSHMSVNRGWNTLVILSAAMSAACLPGVFIWVGGRIRFAQSTALEREGQASI